MSFGTEKSTPVSGKTLSGVLVSKALQSRDQAKKNDNKEKEQQQKSQNDVKYSSNEKKEVGNGVGAGFGLSSIKNMFSPKNGEIKSQEKAPSNKFTKQKGAGLTAILSNGFGSLTADTMGLASSLFSISNILNTSLKAQTFTAGGVQNIASVLSDQLENQSSIISGIKSIGKADNSGKKGGGFGNSASSKSGGGTLTEFLVQKAMDKFGNKLLQSIGNRAANLFKGKAATKVTEKGVKKVATESAEQIAKKKIAQEVLDKGLKSKGAMISGKYVSVGAEEAAKLVATKGTDNVASKLLGGPLSKIVSKIGFKGVAKAIPGIGAILGTVEGMQRLSKGDSEGAALAFASGIPFAGWGALGLDIYREVDPKGYQTNIRKGMSEKDMNKTLQASMSYGNSLPPNAAFSSGGVMVGESSGSRGEEVRSLDSREGKNIFKNSNKTDPGMQTSAASTLTVVDQFIKGMGPLGSPVSQALGSDISALSKTFGMSQTLPNLKIGGAKFTEDGNAVKKRDEFLEKLISGSLEELGAKKKKNTTTPPPPPAPTPPPTPAGGATPAAGGATPPPAKSPSGFFPPASSGVKLDSKKKTNQIKLPIAGHPDNFVLSDRSNGRFEIWKNGFMGMGNSMVSVGTSRDKDTGKFKDKLFSAAYNEVRANYLNEAKEIGLAFKYLTPEDITKQQDILNKSRVNGDQEKGGTIKSYETGGKVKQKPWWDFLGNFIDTHSKTQPEDYKKGAVLGNYAARSRTGGLSPEMMKEYGYEKGGEMFGPGWMPWNFGKTVDKERSRQSTDYANPNSPLAKMAKQREMMKSMGYEKGGESQIKPLSNKFATEKTQYDKTEQRFRNLEYITDKLVKNTTPTKENQNNTTLRSSSGATINTATNNSAPGIDSSTIVNIIQKTSPSLPTVNNEAVSTSNYVGDPYGSGLAFAILSNTLQGV